MNTAELFMIRRGLPDPHQDLVQQPPRERHHGVREDPEIAVRRLVDHFGRDLDENHVLVRPLAQQLREASAHSPFPSAEHL